MGRRLINHRLFFRFLFDGARRQWVVRVPVSLRESIHYFLNFGLLEIADLKARRFQVRLRQRDLLGKLLRFGSRRGLWSLLVEISDLARWLWRGLLSHWLNFGSWWRHICSERLIRLFLK